MFVIPKQPVLPIREKRKFQLSQILESMTMRQDMDLDRIRKSELRK